MTEPSENQPLPYGAFCLSPLRGVFLRCAQNMPVSWLGKRLALLFRRLALYRRRNVPVDALVDNFRMRVHTADNVSERKFLFLPQFFDVSERAYIATHLSPGGVFLDIGANAGIYTLAAARVAALGGGRVIAVEANPIMLERLAVNVGLNNYGGIVSIIPIALSDHPGTTIFSISDTNLGESSIIASSSRQIEVRCDSLLNVLSDHKISTIDGIKIDVEGAEDIILAPFFNDAHASLYPRFVIIENSQARWRSDLPGLMASKGYRLHSRHKMNSIFVLEDLQLRV